MPYQVQGFLLLRRANLSTQARIAIMTLAGNSLSFSDVRKACKRFADEFLRDPKEHDTRGPHTQSICRRQERQVLGQKKRKETTDVETALAALAGESDIESGRNRRCKRYCWLMKSHDSCAENSG